MSIGLTDYFAHFLAFERLRLLKDLENGFNGNEYLENSFFVMDHRDEIFTLLIKTG